MVGLSLEGAEAAKKKNKKKKTPSAPLVVDAADIFTVNTKIKIGKKNKTYNIACLDSTPGKTSQTQQGLVFTPYSKSIKQMQRKKKASSAQLSLLKKLRSAGGKLCVKPPFLSLERYSGPFGEEQARILFDRFSFSASPERVAEAVRDGMPKTIEKMTTYIVEPHLDSVEDNMRCNGLLPGDPRNGTADYQCDRTNPNDIDMGGLKSAILYRQLYSQNGFFEKLFFFLHDRFEAVNTRVLGYCNRWAVVPYVNLIRRAALSGDLIQYTRDFANDYFAAIIWLHLLDSSFEKPNEDFAREILQLGTVGPLNLDGSPTYGDNDIAAAALALSGWIDTYYENDFGHDVCVPAFSQQLHAPGPHVLFAGKPYQSVVYNAEDVIQAAFRHPHTAEEIASKIYQEYINSFATPGAIRELAEIIRRNNYNLMPALKVVMASKALYADQARMSLTKQPLEYIIGFLRITGIPLTGDYYQLRNLMNDVGQVPLSPATVFGWSSRGDFAGQSYVLQRRNAIISILNQDLDDLKDKGFTYWDRFLQGLPTDGGGSMAFINRLQSLFNVKLNPSQVAALDQFLNYDQRTCDRYSNCAPGQQYYLSRRQFDPSIDSEDEGRYTDTNHPYSEKTRGAIAMVWMMAEAQMK